MLRGGDLESLTATVAEFARERRLRVARAGDANVAPPFQQASVGPLVIVPSWLQPGLVPGRRRRQQNVAPALVRLS
eukprot:11213690-Lingulodinium_polyedra.AAC.1